MISLFSVLLLWVSVNIVVFCLVMVIVDVFLMLLDVLVMMMWWFSSGLL